MAPWACNKNLPTCWLALRAAAKAPKRTEGELAEGPQVAVLGLCKKARQCSRMAVVRQDIEPGRLPRACSQPGEKVAPNNDARDWLVPPVEQLLLHQQPEREVQEQWRHPGAASMQHVPRCRHNGIDDKLCVFPQVLAPQ